jgi:quinol monooxygenase YgiN
MTVQGPKEETAAMAKLAMLVTTRTKPGKRDEVRRLYEQRLVPRAEENDAQEVVVWCADHADPDVFHLFEIYRDSEAAQASSQAPWFWEYLTEVGPLLEGQPEVRTAEPTWAKGANGWWGGLRGSNP